MRQPIDGLDKLELTLFHDLNYQLAYRVGVRCEEFLRKRVIEQHRTSDRYASPETLKIVLDAFVGMIAVNEDKIECACIKFYGAGIRTNDVNSQSKLRTEITQLF